MSFWVLHSIKSNQIFRHKNLYLNAAFDLLYIWFVILRASVENYQTINDQEKAIKIYV